MLKYKLIKEEGDVIDYVIEKRGLTSEFTIRDINSNLARMEKVTKELQAQLELEQAKMTNIEHFHPFVKDLSPEDLHTAWMYREAQEYVTQIVPKLEEIKNAVAADEKTVAEVKEALNLDV